jgi:hypothetical protein
VAASITMARIIRTARFVALAVLIQAAAVLGAATAASAAPGAAVYDRTWALVVGVNRFKDARISPLNYAVNDARAVARELERLGFQKQNIVVLLDDRATRAAIEAALGGALRKNAGARDGVFVFFATHGITTALPHGGDEGYLLPHDADVENLPLTALSMQQIKQIGQRLAAKHVLVAVDACYSGYSLVRAVTAPTPTERYLQLVTQSRAIQVMTAGRRDQPVIEDGGHGVFTRALLRGLEGHADLNGDGLVMASELGAWMHPRVAQASDFLQDMQWGNLDGEGQFIFTLPAGMASPVAAPPPAPAPAVPKPAAPTPAPAPPAAPPAVASVPPAAPPPPPPAETKAIFGLWQGTVSTRLTDGMVRLSLARAGDVVDAALLIDSVYFRGRVEDYGPETIELNRRIGQVKLSVVALRQDGRRVIARDDANRLSLDAEVSSDRKRLTGVVSIDGLRYDLRLRRN